MDPQSFDPSRLSSYFGELAETSKPLIPSSTLSSEFRRACGPWISVTTAATKAAFALAGVKDAGQVVDLVLALSGVGDAQAELLKSIKADTLLLRQEPLQTAATFMGEAKRVGASDERYTQFLNHAVKSFYRAKSLAASAEERAVVEFGLACAYLTLEKITDAQHWIGESVSSERQVLNALLQTRLGVIDERRITQEHESTNSMGFLKDAFVKFVVTHPGVLFSTATAVQAGRAAISPAKEQIRKGRIEAFRRFLYFANAVEVSADAIWRRSETKVLDLRGDSGRYILSEKPISWLPSSSLGPLR